MTRRLPAFVACLVICACSARLVDAQTVTQRGFLEGALYLFPQEAPNDPTQVMGDFLAREEVFVKPAPGCNSQAASICEPTRTIRSRTAGGSM